MPLCQNCKEHCSVFEDETGSAFSNCCYAGVVGEYTEAEVTEEEGTDYE